MICAAPEKTDVRTRPYTSELWSSLLRCAEAKVLAGDNGGYAQLYLEINVCGRNLSKMSFLDKLMKFCREFRIDDVPTQRAAAQILLHEEDGIAWELWLDTDSMPTASISPRELLLCG